jgi:hypothetical protein
LTAPEIPEKNGFCSGKTDFLHYITIETTIRTNFMKKYVKYWKCGLICFAALFIMGAQETGCQMLDDPEAFFAEEADERLFYVMTIHEIVKYRRGSDFERMVPSFFGKTVCVNPSYFLHSKDIENIEVIKRVDNPDFYDLRLTLTDRGAKLWSAFAVTTRVDRKEMGILIDGMYYRSFRPPISHDPENRVFVVEGPFDPATAAGLMKNAKRNYRKWSVK